MPKSTAKSTRYLRKLLYLPAIVTFIASLYASEIAGTAARWIDLGPFADTHTTLSCRLPIARAWIIWDCANDHFSATAAPGIAKIGFAAWWHNQVPASDIGFYRISHPENQLDRNVPLHHTTILEKRTFPFSSESLTCWDFIHHNPYTGDHPKDHSIANIECSTESDHFYAYFHGWRGYASTFYATLQEFPVAK